MPSVLQLYNDALSDTGIQQPNQTASGSNIDFTHRKFEDLVRSWSEIRERLFFIPESSYPLTGGLGVYQIGPGAAQFDTTATNSPYIRPVFIQTASVIVGTARRWPLNILTRPEWEMIQTRGLSDPDGPTDFFYDSNHPISLINMAPIPTNAQQLIMSQWNPLPIFYPGDEALLVENYYPEAYLLALRKGLAIQLCDGFNRPVTQQLLGQFQVAVAIIENKNREKMTGAFGFSRTLDAGTTKGDGIMPPAAPPQQQVQ